MLIALVTVENLTHIHVIYLIGNGSYRSDIKLCNSSCSCWCQAHVNFRYNVYFCWCY